jgi:hypothetical protein
MKKFLAAFLLVASANTFAASILLSEDFDNIATLPGSGWAQTNNSSPTGFTNWFQGNNGVFTAQAGADDAYIAANFNNAAAGGNISNWLISPTLTLHDGDTIQFYTRTETASQYADRLELRLSTNGASTNVGASDTSVGDFTSLLLSINPTLDPLGYSDAWTLYTATLSGIGGSISGRFAFRYDVTDTNTNGNYIGIDTVRVLGATSISEPSLLALDALALAMFGLARRYRRPV